MKTNYILISRSDFYSFLEDLVKFDIVTESNKLVISSFRWNAGDDSVGIVIGRSPLKRGIVIMVNEQVLGRYVLGKSSFYVFSDDIVPNINQFLYKKYVDGTRVTFEDDQVLYETHAFLDKWGRVT